MVEPQKGKQTLRGRSVTNLLETIWYIRDDDVFKKKWIKLGIKRGKNDKIPNITDQKQTSINRFSSFCSSASDTVYYYREINAQPERIESENIMQQLTFLASKKTILLFFSFLFLFLRVQSLSSDLTPSAGIREWETFLFSSSSSLCFGRSELFVFCCPFRRVCCFVVVVSIWIWFRHLGCVQTRLTGSWSAPSC